MQGIYKTYGTDKSLEQNGILLDVGPGFKGLPATVRIARAGGANTAFTSLVEFKMKPYRRQIQNDMMDRKVADNLMREVYVKTVILGWENMTDAEGNELPFTEENALKVLEDLPDLWADIQQVSQKAALFREMEREADKGNSATSSSTR